MYAGLATEISLHSAWSLPISQCSGTGVADDEQFEALTRSMCPSVVSPCSATHKLTEGIDIPHHGNTGDYPAHFRERRRRLNRGILGTEWQWSWRA